MAHQWRPPAHRGDDGAGADVAKCFAPFDDLAGLLLPHAFEAGDDGSHDASHLIRVWRNVLTVQASEGGDLRCLAAAVLLRDCVSVEKNDPDRPQASRLSAAKARAVLAGLSWDSETIGRVAHAIAAHSFSAGIVPESLEAKILQDADRLDAIGLIGVARCFYVAGRMGSGLYDPLDPYAEQRDLDDNRFAMDHFETKLLKLADGFQTDTGRRMARDRHARLLDFRERFLDELCGGSHPDGR